MLTAVAASTRCKMFLKNEKLVHVVTKLQHGTAANFKTFKRGRELAFEKCLGKCGLSKHFARKFMFPVQLK